MNKIMTHVVAGYPDKDQCVELMRGMERAGASMIEVQIPFSDPIADGETIMRANDIALRQGMTAEASFALITQAALAIDVYVMSYFQKVQHFGIDKFCAAAARSGAAGLIIPDLPFDAPEFEEFLECARHYKLSVIPVISPGTNLQRVRKALANADEMVYLTSIKGITGKGLRADKNLGDTAKKIKEINPNIRLAVGFGITGSKDLDNVLKLADIAVVGSAVIKKINQSGIKAALEFVERLASN
ncbi:tryptophan synthase subunit alpha [Candidatus Parcubacteria bacterium]|nr:tryptophan synthase subunit alpha [Candidatus Parcubacteria bacterium]